jgi:protein-S-isoprenylcysteine O-methyltransferase Ste14
MKRYIHPPVWVLILIGAAYALHRFAPVARVVPEPFNWAGFVLVVGGLALGGSAARLFVRKKTGLKPFSPSTAFVVEGPYHFTRNPMYLGMTVMLLGVAIVLGTLTPLVAPIAFVAIITWRFIIPEEAHMERTFGASYVEFKGRVRRWL